MQIVMLMVYFSSDAWNTLLSITGVMVLPPYLASTAYLWKISRDGKLLADNKKLGVSVKNAVVSGTVGSLFAVWLIYAAGLEYLLLSLIFLALGIPVFIWTRREAGKRAFTRGEKFCACLIAAIAVITACYTAYEKLGDGHRRDAKTTTFATVPADAKQTQPRGAKPKKPDASPLTKRHGENVIIFTESEVWDIEP